MPSKIQQLPIDVQRKIISLCTEEFIPVNQVGKMYGLSQGTILYFLQKQGINLAELKHTYYDSLAKAAADEHISGMLLKDAAAKYGISTATIEKYMKKHNIVYRNQHGRKNFFNQSFFHDINTEASAYYLGFIFADGNISGIGKKYTRPCRLSINISQKDRIILEQFLEAIEASGNVRIIDYTPNEHTYSNHPMSRLSLNSTRMADDLINLGFHDTKDVRTTIPNMPPQYMRHFVRGYFEGDGCATTHTIQFTGYTMFLSNLSQNLHDSLHIPLKQVYQAYAHKTSVDIGDLSYYTKEQRYKLFQYMYDDVHYYLPRKKQQIIDTLT